MSPEEQYEKDYEQGRRFGFSEAESEVYDLAQRLPKEQRRLVIDAIWQPLVELGKRRREVQS